jgi:biotin carboxyl carrier protein
MRRYTIQIADKQYTIDVQELAADEFYVLAEDKEFTVRLSASRDLAQAAITPEIVPLERNLAAADYRPPALETLGPVPVAPQPPLPPKPHLPTDGQSPDITAPMPGTILSVEVKPGDTITRGQTVAVLEAMKMKNSIKSPRDGVVAEVRVQAGQTVRYGDTLLHFEQAPA